MTAPVAPPIAPLAPSAPSAPSGPSDPTGPSGPTPRPDRGPLVQRVLLGAGALCVLVAGAVYLAVSWDRIGSAGQAGLALVVTALAAVAAHVSVRRGLRASAETFALVASGLLALDLAGAHHLDVLGAARLAWWLWLTVATAAVLVVTAALAAADRLVAYRVVAVAALAVLPFTAVVAADRAGFHSPVGVTTVLALVVATGLTALAVVLGRHEAASALTAVAGAVGWWSIAAGAGVTAAWSHRTYADVLPATLAWAAAAVTVLVAAGRAVATGRRGDAAVVVSVAGPLSAAPAALVLAGAVTSGGAFGPLAVAAVVAAGWALSWTSSRAGRPLGAGAIALAALLVPVGLGRGLGSDVTGGVVLLVGVAAAGGVWHGRGRARVVAVVGAVTAAVVGAGLLAVDRDQPALWLSAAWTAVAVALVLAATFVTGHRAALLAAGGGVGLLATLAGFAAQLLDVRSPALAVALLGLGAVATVHGAVRTSRSAVLLGATGVAAAAMDLALVARVDAVEAYTLPVAAVALVAGILARIGRPELSSWAWTAPAVLVALVPSTAVALGDPGVTRLVVTAAVAAGVAVAGLRFRLAAPLLLAAATEAALAVSQLAPYAAGAPRWVTLALAGVLLLTLGVLFERARRGAAAAGRWYAAMR